MRPTAPRHPIGPPGILVAATVLIVGFALAADAKVPPFEMEVEIDETRAVVTLTIGQKGLDPPDLTGLVAIYPGSELDHEGRPNDQTGGVNVPLTRIAAGTYQGTVRLEPGHWAAVPFPKVMNVSAANLDPYPQAVHFELPTGAAPSLATGGSAAAAIVALAVVVLVLRSWLRPALAAALALGTLGVAAVALAGQGESEFECPVTIPPQPGFSAPEPYPARYPHDGSVWYGTQALWTVLPVDGEYQPRKSVWWSTGFPGGHEEEGPDLHATWTRLDTEEPLVIDNEGQATNAQTAAEGWFMIAGIDPDAAEARTFRPSCWEVTAAYKGATLTYVYELP